MEPVRWEPLRPADRAALEEADLSEWFNPFLTHLTSESERLGGTTQVLQNGGTIVALVLADPLERAATVFSRDRALVAEAMREHPSLSMFAECSLDPTAERYSILRWDRAAGPLAHRFAHAIRPVRARDREDCCRLLREVYGPGGERWLLAGPPPGEIGFLADVDGRPGGLGWLCLERGHGRLHSLAVRAPYRRLGVGTDLVATRLLWAERAGAVDVISEISDRNPASRAAAVRAGMREVGAIYLHPPRAGPGTGASSGSPRSTGTS